MKQICLQCNVMGGKCACKNRRELSVEEMALPVPKKEKMSPEEFFQTMRVYAIACIVEDGELLIDDKQSLKAILMCLGYRFPDYNTIIAQIEAEGLALRATWDLHDGDKVRGTLKGHVCADCVSAYGGKECRCGYPVWVADFAAKAVA